MSGINMCFISCFTGRLNAAEGSGVLCNNTNTVTSVGKLTPTHSSRHFFCPQHERHSSLECAGESPAAKKLIKCFLFFLSLPSTPRLKLFCSFTGRKVPANALGAPEEVLIRAPSQQNLSGPGHRVRSVSLLHP